MLVPLKPVLDAARKGGYAQGAFNVNAVCQAKAVIEAHETLRSAAILQGADLANAFMGGRADFANGTVKDKIAGAKNIGDAVKKYGEDSPIPVVLHLDHGRDMESVKAAIAGGYTSVMIDGSKHEFEENIRITKEVVEYAHAHGVVVEAELGKLAGVEDNIKVDARSATFTDPDEAAEFVERTGVDSLAIAIGTSHGAYKFKGEPYLDFERLKTIHKLIPHTPLVLHGASTVLKEFVDKCNQYGGNIPGAQGVPEAMITEAAKYGICKVNIDTDLRLAMTAEVRKFIAENPAEFDPRKYLGPGRDAIQAMVQHKIKNVLNASNTL